MIEFIYFFVDEFIDNLIRLKYNLIFEWLYTLLLDNSIIKIDIHSKSLDRKIYACVFRIPVKKARER